MDSQTLKVVSQDMEIINRILAAFNVKHSETLNGHPTYVLPETTVVSPVGGFVRYRIHTPDLPTAVTKLAAKLNEALTLSRGVNIYVRFTEPVFGVEVVHPFPKTLGWEMMPDDLQPYQFVVGRDYTQEVPAPLVRSLEESGAPHILTVGTTGSGKTTLVLGRILSLVRSTSPQELGLLVINPKPEREPNLNLLNPLPHMMAPVVMNPEEGVEALRSVLALLERRKAGWDGVQRILVVVCEISEFSDLAGQEVNDIMKRILSVGRSSGVHIWADTQKPLVSVVGSENKGNFPMMVVGRVTNSDDARTAAPGWSLPAHQLPGRGSCYVVSDTGVARVQGHFCNNGIIKQVVGEVVKQDHMPFPMRMLDNPDTPEPGDVVLVGEDEEVRRVRAILPELVDGDGDLKRGAISRVVRLLYGNNTQTGGAYYTRAKYAIAMAMEDA